MRPVIGVGSSFGLEHDHQPPRELNQLLAAYTDAICAAGGSPHILPILPNPDDATLDDLIASVDGLMLTGGWDLDPRHYGATRHAATETMHPRRDAHELALARRADHARVPLFAICLGHQVVHVARGGQLVQHVDDLDDAPVIAHHAPGGHNAWHPVRIAADSRLARIMGGTEVETNSRHHQVVDPQHMGAGLRPVAYAADGVLEASEDCDGRFLVSVQWHPEDLFSRPPHLGLFKALVAAAADWRRR